MPVYQFRHPEHPIMIEVVQSMKEDHIFIDDEGTEWVRVWGVPNAAIDSQVDPFDSKAFVESTRNSKGTMGDLWDQAKEASEKRKDKLGYDPIKQKYFKNYSKSRNGMKHRDESSD
tara:strand:+ start:24 stop:371 length:348 start_codon:yes stop_codon:yes gene_type:complete